jgi:hypothetical protein
VTTIIEYASDWLKEAAEVSSQGVYCPNEDPLNMAIRCITTSTSRTFPEFFNPISVDDHRNIFRTLREMYVEFNRLCRARYTLDRWRRCKYNHVVTERRAELPRDARYSIGELDSAESTSYTYVLGSNFAVLVRSACREGQNALVWVDTLSASILPVSH